MGLMIWIFIGTFSLFIGQLPVFSVTLNIQSFPPDVRTAFTNVNTQISALPSSPTKDALGESLVQLSKEANGKLDNMIMKARVIHVLTGINSAIPKFRSKDPKKIASGVADILFGVGLAINGPAGLTLASIASLTNMVLTLTTPQEIKKSEQALMTEALKDERFRDLSDKAAGVVVVMSSYKGALDEFRRYLIERKPVTETDAKTIAGENKIFKHLKFMTTIMERAKRDGKEATLSQSAFPLVRLFGKLCVFHLEILTETVALLMEADVLPATQRIMGRSYDDAQDLCIERLKFLRPDQTREPGMFGLLANFYPSTKTQENKDLDRVLDFLGIKPIPPFLEQPAATRIISPTAFPNSVLCAGYLPTELKTSTVHGCQHKRGDNMKTKITKDKDGFFTIDIMWKEGKNPNPYSKLCILKQGSTLSITHEFRDKKACQGDSFLFAFVPMDNKRTEYLISPKVSPGHFLYMSNASKPKFFVVKLSATDPGSKGYWRSMAAVL